MQVLDLNDTGIIQKQFVLDWNETSSLPAVRSAAWLYKTS